MPRIDVDFDVFKALTMRRPSEEISENDVLRRLLGLPPRHGEASASSASTPDDWIVKGVRFPAGTEFRASHKGKTYSARVEDGALVLNGKRFDSPSAAAMSITNNPVNGWTFWDARLPGRADWRIIKSYRESDK